MKIQIHFRHLPHPEGLREAIQAWLENQYKAIAGTEPLSVDLFVSNISHRDRSQSRGEVFECHMVARSARFGRLMFAKVAGVDVWLAFTGCAHRLFKQMAKDLKAKRSKRKMGGEIKARLQEQAHVTEQAV